MSFFRTKRNTIKIVFILLTYILVYAIGKFYGYMDRMCHEVANDLDLTLKSLFQMVESLQVKHDTPYIPPAFWQKHKGMWETDFKFYFHGSEEMYLLREAFSIYDENMFATAWITSCLIEAFRFGKGPKPSEKTISAAVSSLEKYHDKNLDYSNSLMTFWPQQYDKTHGVWTSYSANSLHYRELVVSTAEKILKVEVKGIANVMEKFHKSLNPCPTPIPPDFDDTFFNFGIGALLAEMKEYFPIAHAQWQSQNTNVTSAFNALKKYAYRPMSTNKAINAIDCRTYFYLRFFLEKAKENGEDIALVPTWIQDTEEARMLGANGDSMPFSYNNIDVTVAANVVFGTTSAVLNGVVGVSVLDDPEIKQIYVNTTNLIANMIETNFSSRPDLALLYYPSAIEFYWFVARTYGEIRRKEKHGPLPHPVLKKVESILDRPLHVTMTSAIVKQAHIDDDGNIYFEDFLGNGDNSTKTQGEDRLFTTAIAMNALLSTWTVFDEKTERLYWEKGTPESVKDVLSKSAKFLLKHIFGLTYKPLNVFFSATVKGRTTFPIYPSTRDRKGAFEGVLSEEYYHQ